MRSVSSLIWRRSRSSITAARWAAMTPRWICLVLDPLLAPLGGLVGVLGREVLRCGPAGRTPADREAAGGRPVGAGALDLVEAGLVGGLARKRLLVAVELDAVPAGPANQPRQRQPLADERHEDDRERHQQDEVRAPGSPPAARAPRPGKPRRGGPPSRRRTSAARRAADRAARSAVAASRAAGCSGRPTRTACTTTTRADQRDEDDDLRRRSAAAGPRRIAGSSSPMSTNTKPFRTNPTIFQVLSQSTRLRRGQDLAQAAADDQTRTSRPRARPTGRARRPAGRRRTG